MVNTFDRDPNYDGSLSGGADANFTFYLRSQLAEGFISEGEFIEAWDSWVDRRLEERAITAQEYLNLNQRFLQEHEVGRFDRVKSAIGRFARLGSPEE